jgi:hypothetical protein
VLEDLWEVQADESLRFGYSSARYVVVDAYMAQHPGDGDDRRDRQSVFVHLVGLCAALELGLPPKSVTGLIGSMIQSHADFPQLPRPADPGTLNVLHMVNAVDLDDYGARAREWAMVVWGSWSELHTLIRASLGKVMGS